MMNWDTYATLLDMEQTERAEKGLPPLFGENQKELLNRKKRQKMIDAMKTIQNFCLEEPCNIECPFVNNCFRSVSPAWWEIPEEDTEK